MSKTRSLNSSTKNAILNFAIGTLGLDPSIKISPHDSDLIAMARTLRDLTQLQNNIKPMLNEHQIPQTLTRVNTDLDPLENNRATQSAHQSISPRVLDVTVRVSERTEQHGRLAESLDTLIDKTTNFFRKTANQLWTKDGKQSSSPLMQQPEFEAIKKEFKEHVLRRDDLAKNLPELNVRLKALHKEIKSHGLATPTQGGQTPRQEQG